MRPGTTSRASEFRVRIQCGIGPLQKGGAERLSRRTLRQSLLGGQGSSDNLSEIFVGQFLRGGRFARLWFGFRFLRFFHDSPSTEKRRLL